MGFTHYRLHFRVWKFTYSSVLLLLKKKKKKKRPPHAETHIFFRMYFPMRRYTFSRVFPHVEIHMVLCNSSYGFNTLLLTYYRMCMNIHSPCIFLLLKKYFHMWRYTRKRVSPHVEIHIILCNFSLSLVFPHVEIYSFHSVFPFLKKYNIFND